MIRRGEAWFFFELGRIEREIVFERDELCFFVLAFAEAENVIGRRRREGRFFVVFVDDIAGREFER